MNRDDLLDLLTAILAQVETLEAENAELRQALAIKTKPAEHRRRAPDWLKDACVAEGMPWAVVVGKCRLAHVVRVRQAAMVALRQTGWSLPDVGAAFFRDHTTVMHATTKADKALVFKMLAKSFES